MTTTCVQCPRGKYCPFRDRCHFCFARTHSGFSGLFLRFLSQRLTNVTCSVLRLASESYRWSQTPCCVVYYTLFTPVFLIGLQSNPSSWIGSFSVICDLDFCLFCLWSYLVALWKKTCWGFSCASHIEDIFVNIFFF